MILLVMALKLVLGIGKKKNHESYPGLFPILKKGSNKMCESNRWHFLREAQPEAKETG